MSNTSEPERRATGMAPAAELLRDELNPNQRAMLEDLERFGWTLRFVRRSPDGEMLPVAQPFADDAVLRDDGQMDQPDGFVLRKPRPA